MLLCSLDAALLCDDRQFRNPHSSHWYPWFTTQSLLVNAHTWKHSRVYKVTASASFNRPALIQFPCKQPCRCQAKSISEAREKTANLIFTSSCWAVAVDLEPQSWKRLRKLFTLHLSYSATYVLDESNNDLNVMLSWINGQKTEKCRGSASFLFLIS